MGGVLEVDCEGSLEAKIPNTAADAVAIMRNAPTDIQIIIHREECFSFELE